MKIYNSFMQVRDIVYRPQAKRRIAEPPKEIVGNVFSGAQPRVDAMNYDGDELRLSEEAYTVNKATDFLNVSGAQNSFETHAYASLSRIEDDLRAIAYNTSEYRLNYGNSRSEALADISAATRDIMSTVNNANYGGEYYLREGGILHGKLSFSSYQGGRGVFLDLSDRNNLPSNKDIKLAIRAIDREKLNLFLQYAENRAARAASQNNASGEILSQAEGEHFYAQLGNAAASDQDALQDGAFVELSNNAPQAGFVNVNPFTMVPNETADESDVSGAAAQNEQFANVTPLPDVSATQVQSQARRQSNETQSLFSALRQLFLGIRSA